LFDVLSYTEWVEESSTDEEEPQHRDCPLPDYVLKPLTLDIPCQEVTPPMIPSPLQGVSTLQPSHLPAYFISETDNISDYLYVLPS
jgi:hypothetical protein